MYSTRAFFYTHLPIHDSEFAMSLMLFMAKFAVDCELNSWRLLKTYEN